jgi:hypothetical protein
VVLKQAFEAMMNSYKVSEKQAKEISEKGKEVAMIGSIDNLSKLMPTTDGAESSRQAATRREGSGKSPYCFRCMTKGHAIEDYHANMFCDICESQDHLRVWCPKFRAIKDVAVPCGFAVEGLGFFHIPHESSAKQLTKARSTLISVTDGVLTVENVITELQRLILGGWVWNVEAVGNISFCMVFPSCPKLLRMVEWGVFHSKFQNAKLWIEERMVDNEVHFVLLKVWVQFTGLPPHLRDLSDYLGGQINSCCLKGS